VKRLMRVNFSEQNRSFRGSRSRKSSSRGTEDDRPSYVLKAGDGLTQALTGRLCNEDLDVIHFTLVAVVDARSVMAFMDGLCSAKQHKFSGWDGTASPPQTFKHNQITILESVITAVDVEDDDHGLYRYGDDAVMEVELICEYIFNKAACDAVKPDVVKEAIKEAQTTKKSTRRGR